MTDPAIPDEAAVAARQPFGERALRLGVLASLFLLAALTLRALLAGWNVDPDTFFHLAAGRWIVEHRAIPGTDVLSWYGQLHATRWFAQEWLFDAGIYLAWKAGGFQAVYALTAALFGGAVLAARRLADIKGSGWLRSLVVAVVAIAGCVRFVSPRPGAVTFLLLPLIAILLERDRWIPALLLFVLGMNFHGGAYPIYLLVIAYYSTRKRPWLLPAAAVLVLATPLTYELLKYPFFTLTPLARYIQEYQATSLATDWVLLAVLVACWLALDRERVAVRDLIAAGVLAALSLGAVRTQPYFYLLALPALAASMRLPRRGERPSAEGALAGLGDVQRLPLEPRTRDGLLLAGLLVCALAAGLAAAPRIAIDPDRGYPSGALGYVKSHRIERIWNEWNDGGYLMWNEVPPLVDGRLDPFYSFFNPGTTLAMEYMSSYRGTADVRPLLRRYGIDYLVVHRDAALYRVLAHSRDFAERYRDPVASVFEFVPGGP